MRCAVDSSYGSISLLSSLSNNHIGDEGVSYLAQGLARNHGLRELRYMYVIQYVNCTYYRVYVHVV